MLAASLATDRGRPLRTVRLRGNGPDGRRCDVVATEAATRIPVLRRLPLLLSVVRGDLRLVGVEALSPEEADARGEEWQLACDEAPVGLVGPAQLELGRGAAADEKRVVEAFYARTRSASGDLRWALRAARAVLGPRAWVPAARHVAAGR